MKKRIVVISLILIFVVLTATFAGGCSGKYFKYEDFDIKLDVVKGDDNVISVCVALRNKSVKSGLVKGGSQLIYITCESENGEFDRDYLTNSSPVCHAACLLPEHIHRYSAPLCFHLSGSGQPP